VPALRPNFGVRIGHVVVRGLRRDGQGPVHYSVRQTRSDCLFLQEQKGKKKRKKTK
jgi:hypothetical protein